MPRRPTSKKRKTGKSRRQKSGRSLVVPPGAPPREPLEYEDLVGRVKASLGAVPVVLFGGCECGDPLTCPHEGVVPDATDLRTRRTRHKGIAVGNLKAGIRFDARRTARKFPALAPLMKTLNAAVENVLGAKNQEGRQPTPYAPEDVLRLLEAPPVEKQESRVVDMVKDLGMSRTLIFQRAKAARAARAARKSSN